MKFIKHLMSPQQRVALCMIFLFALMTATNPCDVQAANCARDLVSDREVTRYQGFEKYYRQGLGCENDVWYAKVKDSSSKNAQGEESVVWYWHVIKEGLQDEINTDQWDVNLSDVRRTVLAGPYFLKSTRNNSPSTFGQGQWQYSHGNLDLNGRDIGVEYFRFSSKEECEKSRSAFVQFVHQTINQHKQDVSWSPESRVAIKISNHVLHTLTQCSRSGAPASSDYSTQSNLWESVDQAESGNADVIHWSSIFPSEQDAAKNNQRENSTHRKEQLINNAIGNISNAVGKMLNKNTSEDDDDMIYFDDDSGPPPRSAFSSFEASPEGQSKIEARRSEIFNRDPSSVDVSSYTQDDGNMFENLMNLGLSNNEAQEYAMGSSTPEYQNKIDRKTENTRYHSETQTSLSTSKMPQRNLQALSDEQLDEMEQINREIIQDELNNSSIEQYAYEGLVDAIMSGIGGGLNIIKGSSQMFLSSFDKSGIGNKLIDIAGNTSTAVHPNTSNQNRASSILKVGGGIPAFKSGKSMQDIGRGIKAIEETDQGNYLEVASEVFSVAETFHKSFNRIGSFLGGTNDILQGSSQIREAEKQKQAIERLERSGNALKADALRNASSRLERIKAERKRRRAALL